MSWRRLALLRVGSGPLRRKARVEQVELGSCPLLVRLGSPSCEWRLFGQEIVSWLAAAMCQWLRHQSVLGACQDCISRQCNGYGHRLWKQHKGITIPGSPAPTTAPANMLHATTNTGCPLKVGALVGMMSRCRGHEASTRSTKEVVRSWVPPVRHVHMAAACVVGIWPHRWPSTTGPAVQLPRWESGNHASDICFHMHPLTGRE